MKKILLILAILAGCATQAWSLDVLYLRNGSVIKGALVKLVPGGDVSMEIYDGRVMTYATSQATRLAKDEEQVTYYFDAITLNDATVVRGVLTEYLFGEKATVVTPDGSVFVFAEQEVAQVMKDKSVTIAQYSRAQVAQESEEQEYAADGSYYDGMYNGGYNDGDYAAQRSGAENYYEITRHQAPRGYRGFFSFAVAGRLADEIAVCEFSTTHGYHFNPYCFLGLGMGLEAGVNCDYLAVPIFAEFRGNMGRGVVQFTYGTRLGVAIQRVNSYSYDQYYHLVVNHLRYPLLWNVNAGLRIGLAQHFALSISPDFTTYIATGYYDAALGLRISMDF